MWEGSGDTFRKRSEVLRFLTGEERRGFEGGWEELGEGGTVEEVGELVAVALVVCVLLPLLLLGIGRSMWDSFNGGSQHDRRRGSPSNSGYDDGRDRD